MEPQAPTTGLLYFPITGPEDEPGIPAPGSKRRRLRGACAECRQKKVRCDRATQLNNVCSNCVAFNSQCTDPGSSSNGLSAHSSSSAPSADPGLYKDKTAAEHVDAILVQSTAYISSRDVRQILLEVARYSRGLEEELKKSKTPSFASPGSSIPADSPSPNASSSNDYASAGCTSTYEMALAEDLESMIMIQDSTRSRYFGRSSNQYLLRTAEELKTEHEGPSIPLANAPRRRQFWESPWQRTPPFKSPVYNFPPKDLMDNLISLYFRHVNILFPILHRPTFERSVTSGLHLTDPAFGAVALAVCAVASRYSDDPRVIFEGTNKLSSGWEWFQQIRYPENPDFYFALTLYDLQRIMLAILFLHVTSSPGACWSLIGIGLRNLQDLGRHRRKQYHSVRNIEDEMYKRVFWMFIVGDAYTSAFLGRPRATTDDHHDVDYPVECDDEYWEHPDPEKRFQQPEGKPSILAFFVTHLKLMAILGIAQKTIYSLNLGKQNLEVQSKVAELDSALNQWLDSIPAHLRWDPYREDEIFATQSATLYASYYQVQIQIHRGFIQSPSNNAPLSSSFPSLAICSNAARACTHVMETQARRNIIAHPQAISCLMDSALILLVNVWGARRTGTSADPQRVASDVRKCIGVLKLYETHFQLAGRFCDILFAIGNQLIRNPPLPTPTSQTLKRSRDTETPGSSVSPSSSSSMEITPQESRSIASNRRVSAVALSQQHAQEQASHLNEPVDLSYLYSLPVSTQELGASPAYEPQTALFDWGTPVTASDLALSDIELMFNFGASPSTGERSVDSGNPLPGHSYNYEEVELDPVHKTRYDPLASYYGGDWANREWTSFAM